MCKQGSWAWGYKNKSLQKLMILYPYEIKQYTFTLYTVYILDF